MKIFDQKDIENLHHLYRINLINSCSGYKSANLIGTQSKDGQTNLAVFSSVMHLGSNPPLIGFILRPDNVPRHTYENIMETGVYTVNHVFKDIVSQAHHTSAKYAKEVSEFEVTGLKPVYKNNFHAPFVEGSPVQLAMTFDSALEIASNQTKLIIGKIQTIYLDESALSVDGYYDLSKVGVATINGLDAYSIPTENQRLGYQRPQAGFEQRDKPIKKI
jgi:flavin reductase (DIM6/NTAB) family NADH-FMN oxidoreductase RutF